MKIGFLTVYYPPFKGGLESHVPALAKRLAKEHEVHVYTVDRKAGEIIPAKEEILDGVHVHRFTPLVHYRFYFLVSFKMFFAIMRQPLDVLHVHGFGFFWFDRIVFYKKLLSWKTRFVNTPHGPFMALANYSLWKRFLKFFVWSFELLFNKIYDAVIQVNPTQISWMRRSGVSLKKIVYVPNGIDSHVFASVDAKKFLTSEQLTGKTIISTVGRITRYKGIDQVLAVLPSLVKKYPKLVYVIAGRDDGDVARLRKIVADASLGDHVRIYVNIAEDDKWALLAASSLFVISSEWEAFGIAPLEAMAQKTAVVSTKTEGCQFLVTPACGLLYDFGDLSTLEAHLDQLLSDKKLRTSMQEAAFVRAQEFLWDAIVPQVERVYRG